MFVLVYSVDSRESFDEVKRLLDEIYQAKGQYTITGTSPSRGGDQSCSDPPGIRAALIYQAKGQCSFTGTPPSRGGDQSCSDPPAVRRPRGKNSPPMVVVGNKCDRELHRMVTPGELQVTLSLHYITALVST